MNDKELQKEMLKKISKLRRLNDAIGERSLRHAIDEHLTRVFLLVRDGNLDCLNGGTQK